MKNYFFLFLVSSFLISGCNTSHTGDGAEASITHLVKVGDPKTVATLDIDGMMCSMACGGKIRKELESVDGVTLATIDFEDDRDLNQAVVTFDPNKTDEKTLIQAVNQIADGKLYSVTSAKVVTFEKSSSESASRSIEDGEEVGFDVQRVFTFPNVFHLLDKLIR